MLKKQISAALVALAAFSGTALAQETQPATTEPAQAPAAPAMEVRSTHGDWRVICATAQPDNCLMNQMAKNGQGQDAVEVALRRIPAQQVQGGNVSTLLDIVVPVGVLLKPGLALSIDSSQPMVAPFTVCNPRACIVREPIADQMVGNFKKGASSKVMVVSGNGQKQEITVSLSGFTAAYNALPAK